MIEDGVAVIGLVGDDMGCPHAFDQRQGVTCITGLALCEQEPDRTAQTIHGDMPFARQPASGAPQSLVLDPPFLPVAA